MTIKAKTASLLEKAEVTYGTDPVPVVATDALLVYDVKISPLKLETDGRNIVLPWFGNQGHLITGKYCQIEYKVEIAGAGAAGTAPGYAACMKSCGLAETNNPGVSDAFAPATPAVGSDISSTLYFNIGGRLHKINGAMGSVMAVLEAGKRPYFQFTKVGLYGGVTDVALAAPTLTAFQKPLAVNNANTTPATLFTYAAKFRRMEIDLGCVYKYRNVVNSEAVRFTDRQSVARFTFEGTKIAEKDFWSIIAAETLGAFTVTQGTIAGNKVTIAAPNVQLLEPTSDEEDGVEMTTIPANLKPSSAGNDELSITVL